MWEAFVEAAENGDTARVQGLIAVAAGADVSHLVSEASEALRRAALYGHMETAEDALKFAADRGYTALVKMLIATGADVHARDNAAILTAAYGGDMETMKVLMAVGMDINTLSSALRNAAQRGHTAMVEMLIAAGADVHFSNNYAVRWAARYGHILTVEVLIAAGADIRAEDDSALIWAVDNKHTEMVRVLVAAGADIHARDDCLLRDAADAGDTAMLRALHSRDVDSGQVQVCSVVGTAPYIPVPPHILTRLVLPPDADCPVCLRTLANLCPNLSMGLSCGHMMCTGCAGVLAANNIPCPPCHIKK